MVEIKPWGFINNSATKTLRDRAQCDLTITKKPTHNINMPLYTAEQLTQAVTAERERCLTAIEEACIATNGWGDPIDDGDCERNEGIDLALEAIRSAAK